MIVKYLKKILPDPNRFTHESGLKSVRGYLLNSLLWQINRKSIAKGVAIGLLIAFVPLPFQMLFAALLAICFSANLPIAVVLTWITNPLTFLPINSFIYKVGQWILHDTSYYHTLPVFDFSGKSWSDIIQQFFQWMHVAGKPFLVGLLVVAISASILGYTLVQLVWRLAIYWYLHLRKKRH